MVFSKILAYVYCLDGLIMVFFGSTLLYGLFSSVLVLRPPLPPSRLKWLTLWNDYFGQLVEKVKANAAASTDHNNVKPFTGTNTPKTNPEQPQDAECQLPKCSEDVPKHESSSMLPRDFCDDSGKIRTRSGKNLVQKMKLYAFLLFYIKS